MIPRVEPVEVGLVLKEQFEALSLQARRKEVKLESQLPAGTVLYADPLLLAEVLHNVLSNALKFSHPGGVVRVLGGEKGDLGRVLVVQDDGIGMPKPVLQSLFDPAINECETPLCQSSLRSRSEMRR